MDNKTANALAELGLDAPDPAPLTRLLAGLFAEPDALRAWAAESNHARLSAAYEALANRVAARAEDTRCALAAAGAGPGSDVEDAQQAARAEADAAQHELARLKWLLVHRTERLAAGQALGAEYNADAEQQEREIIRDLLVTAGKGLC